MSGRAPLCSAVSLSAALVVLLTACSSAPAATVGTTPIPPSGGTQAPTVPPATIATSEPGVTPAPATEGPLTTAPPETLPPIPSFAIPSFSFTPDLQLESLFPKKIDGNPVKVQSLHLRDLVQVFESDPKSKKRFQDFLSAVGRSIDDVTAAIATVTINGQFELITAVRVAGIDPGTFLQAFVAFTIDSMTTPSDAVTGTADLGGKHLVTISDKTNPSGDVTYIYSFGEVIFEVRTDKPAVATKIFDTLP